MKKQNVRTLALIVCTFTYLLIGAAIYDALESKHETAERERLKIEADELQAKYNITEEDFEILRINIIKNKPYRAGTQWKFAGSFYFSLSVITTIGYGHSTPRTMGGKSFCIVYALIGIPLNIVMFQSIGERFNIGITLVMKKIKQCFRLKKTRITQTELTVVAVILCLMVLLGGAASFHYFEKWGFADAFYYCFITMSTIGFGDFVALQNDTMDALESRPEYVAFSILYILFGLTVFAAALNLMVLRLLTMNTEDERKDELEALAAARGAVIVDGDIITGTGVVNTAMSDMEDGIVVQPVESSSKQRNTDNLHSERDHTTPKHAHTNGKLVMLTHHNETEQKTAASTTQQSTASTNNKRATLPLRRKLTLPIFSKKPIFSVFNETAHSSQQSDYFSDIESVSSTYNLYTKRLSV